MTHINQMQDEQVQHHDEPGACEHLIAPQLDGEKSITGVGVALHSWAVRPSSRHMRPQQLSPSIVGQAPGMPRWRRASRPSN